MKRSNGPEPSLLTVKEVAQHLRCHEHTVRRWIWAGKVASVKVGDLVRIPRTELSRMIRAEGPTTGRSARRRQCTARSLLDLFERLRGRFDPEDAMELDRLIREGEQPADWSSPIA